MKTIFYAIIFSNLLFVLTGCAKFLDEKSDLKLAVPETAEDNQALLDKSTFSNTASSGEFSADDVYLTDLDYSSLEHEESRRLYTWQPDYVSKSTDVGNDWYYCYGAILIANTVLYNLKTYHIEADNVKGQAYAFRASCYLDAAQIWCPVYNPETATTDLGLPLRLDPDMDIPSKRATVQQTYSQILSDLHAAIALLPDKQLSPIRLSKVAALGLLSRTYLYMGDYVNAQQYAKQALSMSNSLMDFNALNPLDAYPIKDQNSEVIYLTTINGGGFPRPPKPTLALYQAYADNDLRKQIYYSKTNNGEVFFRGGYTGRRGYVTGITTDELYLVSAESLARTDKVPEAMEVLNRLLVTRWKTGTYTNLTAQNKEEALSLILAERRKELPFRGIRWADLKRLNREGANITLSRTVNGQTYTLPPNDLRYAIALPEDIIAMTGMPQNKR